MFCVRKAFKILDDDGGGFIELEVRQNSGVTHGPKVLRTLPSLLIQSTKQKHWPGLCKLEFGSLLFKLGVGSDEAKRERWFGILDQRGDGKVSPVRHNLFAKLEMVHSKAIPSCLCLFFQVFFNDFLECLAEKRFVDTELEEFFTAKQLSSINAYLLQSSEVILNENHRWSKILYKEIACTDCSLQILMFFSPQCPYPSSANTHSI